MTQLRVADEFSPYLGGRYRTDGPWSGEQFRDDFLWPALDQVRLTHGQVHVIFDGVAGMPPSFLEEAFGGILRKHSDVTPAELKALVKLDAKDPELWPFIRLALSFIEQQAKRQ